MRLHFQLSPNDQAVPFDYPHFLTGVFHRWMGQNSVHDALSLYSLGWLQGGQAQGHSLQFERGAKWFVSAPDTAAGTALLEKIATAAMLSPEVCCGMKVLGIHNETTPEFGSRRIFRAGSPVLARGKEGPDGRVPHYTWDDPLADEALTQTLRHKLDAAGLSELSHGATMAFDRSYRGAKTKLISIKGTQNRANFCPVIVGGGPLVVQFAWSVGAGHKTGSGFGSLV